MVGTMAASAANHAALSIPLWEWSAFVGLVTSFILLDLFVLNRKKETPTVTKAAVQTLMWVLIGAALGAAVWLLHGANAGNEYYTGWIIEYSLSVDNVFVWSVILDFFVVAPQFRHRVLFWGIFGALAMRFTFITVGVTLINKFAPFTIVMGAFLIWTAWKLATSDDDDEMNVGDTKSYKFFEKRLPLTDADYDHQGRFFARVDGKLLATLLFLCLCLVELFDVMFAVDSVPAILAVAKDPFIIFASNAMAILGLRSLFFLFDAVKHLFSRLNEGLAFILGGVGVKMILASDMSVFGLFQMPGIEIPTWISLTAIGTILAGSIVASKIWPEKAAEPEADAA